MKKIISILGSTGSIGNSTLRVIDKKRKYFEINLLWAKSNYKKICYQIIKYNPKIFIVSDSKVFLKVKKKFSKKKIIILNKISDFNYLKKNDITISAIPGIAGLAPTLKMIKLSKKILIANKEAIVCGWNLIKVQLRKNRTKIIPIDSEHYSIMKLLENHSLNEIKKIYITASGGPFLNYKSSQFKKITPSKALNHPKWKMGKKISVDSATLMNKIFELIEAKKLFSIPKEKIDILVHPNSLVHAIIDLKNGLTKFLYHETSMIVTIANAIFEGDLNIKNFYNCKKLENTITNNHLSFYRVNKKNFPIIDLKSRLTEMPSTPIILNAANELLVEEFLKRKISFLSINKYILEIMNDINYKKYAIKTPKNIKQIYEIDTWAKSVIREKI